MSTFILFFLRVLVFVGPGTQDICCLPLNKYSFFIVCVSTGAFRTILHELYQFSGCMAYLKRPSWITVELIFSELGHLDFMGYSARAKRAFGLHGLSWVGELVKVSYWAPGAEALVAFHPELI